MGEAGNVGNPRGRRLKFLENLQIRGKLGRNTNGLEDLQYSEHHLGTRSRAETTGWIHTCGRLAYPKSTRLRILKRRPDTQAERFAISKVRILQGQEFTLVLDL